MTPILQQFLSESRDVLQDIGEKLIRFENAPTDTELMGELFRLVHTLKGNCGLFDFPEMARVLHAAEDLMVVVRAGGLAYSQTLADRLLDAMDFVGMLQDEIEASGNSSATHAAASAKLAQSLRELIPSAATENTGDTDPGVAPDGQPDAPAPADNQAALRLLGQVPLALRTGWYQQAHAGEPLMWVSYTPEPECFFKGEDPFFQARQTPGVVWQRVLARDPWPALAELDAYRCGLNFQMVSTAPLPELEEHFRYVTEQVAIFPVTASLLVASLETEKPAPVQHPVPAATQGGPGAEHSTAATQAIMGVQLTVLGLPDQGEWLPGRLKAVAATLNGCLRCMGLDGLLPGLDAALAAALEDASAAPLRTWLLAQPLTPRDGDAEPVPAQAAPAPPPGVPTEPPADAGATPKFGRRAEDAAAAADGSPKLGRRAEDAPGGPKTLKVDQDKINRLMDLIGEMVVSKNGLPYLAARAESVFGVRELSREIKTQYAVINRIAEEMQDAIMQVRMMPVSFVFQRFPRLVRDISRRLGKEVNLVLEGEETEADKNIIEALADPLIHIVRNSMDHGIEMPEVRRAAGKPAAGRLTIRASQEADRVVIDISDDGKGIDPAVIKRKAYEKGLIDEALLERISDQDAVNLVFAAGFSTAEVVSDLSGRGVGMDVVRAAVEQVNGTVTLESTAGQGTRLRLSLPLSMAVTNVMIIESDQQIYGVPMDMVVETVRIPRAAVHSIKSHQTAVLRGRIVPLRSLNQLLATDKPQRSNDEDELATLVVRLQGEQVGIVVDDFREVVDIILKPMAGILGGLPGFSGSALLGDGSVLMVLNPKELV